MKIRLVIIMLSVAFAGQLRAATIAVSNLGQPTAPFTYALGRSYPDSDFLEAVSFTTGPGTHNLDSVVLSFYSRNGEATGFNVGLYSALSSAGPTGLVTTFTGNSMPSTALETYTPLSSTTLLGGTTYWLVGSSSSTAPLTGFSMAGTTSLAEDAGALLGWSMGNFRMVSNNSGASWFAATPTSGVLHYSVQVASVPDSGATAALLGIALVGVVAMRRQLQPTPTTANR
jgi:hypothetical protein